MILEIAEIEVKPGEESAFEASVQAAKPAFARSKGFLGLTLQHSVENCSRYLLFVQWETLDDHLVHFRNSANFAEWRRLAEPHFATPPRVEHYEAI